MNFGHRVWEKIIYSVFILISVKDSRQQEQLPYCTQMIRVKKKKILQYKILTERNEKDF